MTTFHVQSDTPGDLRIYPTQLSRTLVFEGGRYETDDPREIRALRNHPLVFDATDLDSDVAADDLEKLTREDLDQRAAAAGIDSPESLPNKQAVIDALTDDAG